MFERFGDVFDQYEGLYWSHFQASLDWADAEMWLEGAIHNGWSVSQMRGKRWETLGNVGDPPFEENAEAIDEGEAASAAGSGAETAVAPTQQTAGASPAARETSEKHERSQDDESELDEESAESIEEPAAPRTGKTRKPLAVDVDDLPADLAEAFEQFKLAIIAQRRAGWRETTPAAVIECLDALKELALAPADD